jgi:ABC-type dipeptide/oligopeptide/nickel transport system ATPase component
MNSWNPVQRVGAQILEAINLHFKPRPPAAEARQRMEDLFNLVGVDPKMLDRYPHEFSGGMRQRATIAMALSCDPQLIIADEPTTALDVIVQDQILKQLLRIQRELDGDHLHLHDIAHREVPRISPSCTRPHRRMGRRRYFAQPRPLRASACSTRRSDHGSAASWHR